ncbi:hypothetical protein LRS05_13355 [Flavobacterium sp. J372]|uniref:hypothetical protein n=1 Tax=Flavobacterium sp. J372 TaxID=2898436 RepID=UPI002151514B|nr:hypothetical protein [Flavobacterium sp. J372]MCR5863051.1 hypothetical protein [Flavobacterium sp. J372]
MLKQIDDIRKLQKEIKSCRAEITTALTLPYYTVFNKKTEQEADLEVLRTRLGMLLQTEKQLLQTLWPAHTIQ